MEASYSFYFGVRHIGLELIPILNYLNNSTTIHYPLSLQFFDFFFLNFEMHQNKKNLF